MGSLKEATEDLVSNAKQLHARIISSSGGLSGIRDEGGLYNSLWKIHNQLTPDSDPFKVGAHTFLEFSTRHHFNDGNKRFSYIYAKILLLYKGYLLDVPYKQAVPFIVSIAHNQRSPSEIVEWIKSNSKEATVSEAFSYDVDTDLKA